MSKAFNLIPAPKVMLSLLGIVVIAVAVAVIALVIKALVNSNQKEGFEMDKMSTAVVSIFGGFLLLGAIFALVLLVANMKSA
jgi:hypothetical protein